MPATSTKVGSDQGPAGSSAVTKKLWAPASVTFVVIIQNRPSWWRSVGAKTPSDDHPPVSAQVQLRRSVEHVADQFPVDEVR